MFLKIARAKRPPARSGLDHQVKLDPGCINHLFSGMAEIHRDLAADVRLHLAWPPIRPVRVSNQVARVQKRANSTHVYNSLTSRGRPE